MPQTLRLEQEELLKRAAELEAPMPPLPSVTPLPPCSLPAAQRAARQMALSVENLRLYLASGEREQRRLAQSLRNAAAAYGDADERCGWSLNSGGRRRVGSSPVTDVDDAGTDPASLRETETVPALCDRGYKALLQAAHEIEQPDQAASMMAVANEWVDYRRVLLGAFELFRPFEAWDGDAATRAEESMAKHKQWLVDMVKTCDLVWKNAEFIVTIHMWAVRHHPKEAEVRVLEMEYRRWADNKEYRDHIMGVQQAWQQKSENILFEYNRKIIPPAITPPRPPTAVRIAAPREKGLIPQSFMPQSASDDADKGQDQGQGQRQPTGMSPTMQPAMSPGTGGGRQMPDTSAMLKSLQDAAKIPEPSVSQMSAGGGGGKMPAMPPMPVGPGVSSLQPPTPVGTGGPGMFPASTIPGGGAGPGGAGAGTGGGGGMPMAPMGGAGQSQGQGQGKQSDDKLVSEGAIYVENRAWTEAVIGNRRRKSEHV